MDRRPLYRALGWLISNCSRKWGCKRGKSVEVSGLEGGASARQGDGDGYLEMTRTAGCQLSCAVQGTKPRSPAGPMRWKKAQGWACGSAVNRQLEGWEALVARYTAWV
jgi:hypothetical protein